MGRWLPGTPLFLWPIKVVSWAGIRQKNVPKDTVCALCFKFEFFSSLQKISDIFFGEHSSYLFCLFSPFFCIIDISSAARIFSHHDNTIKLFVAEKCVRYKNIWGGRKKYRGNDANLSFKLLLSASLFDLLSAPARSDVELKFHFLDFSFLFFSFLSCSTAAIGSEGPSRCSIPWVNTASENFPCVDSKAPFACNRVTLL